MAESSLAPAPDLPHTTLLIPDQGCTSISFSTSSSSSNPIRFLGLAWMLPNCVQDDELARVDTVLCRRANTRDCYLIIMIFRRIWSSLPERGRSGRARAHSGRCHRLMALTQFNLQSMAGWSGRPSKTKALTTLGSPLRAQFREPGSRPSWLGGPRSSSRQAVQVSKHGSPVQLGLPAIVILGLLGSSADNNQCFPGCKQVAEADKGGLDRAEREAAAAAAGQERRGEGEDEDERRTMGPGYRLAADGNGALLSQPELVAPL